MKKIIRILSLVVINLLPCIAFANITFSDIYVDGIISLFEKHVTNEESKAIAYQNFIDAYDTNKGISADQFGEKVCVAAGLSLADCQNFVTDMGALSIKDSLHNRVSGGSYSFLLVQDASDEQKLNNIVQKAKEYSDSVINKYIQNENNVLTFDSTLKNYQDTYGEKNGSYLRVSEVYKDGLTSLFVDTKDFYEMCFLFGVEKANCQYSVKASSPLDELKNYKTCLEDAGLSFCKKSVLNPNNYDISELVKGGDSCYNMALTSAQNNWYTKVSQKYNANELDAAYQAYRNFWVLKKCGDMSNLK